MYRLLEIVVFIDMCFGLIGLVVVGMGAATLAGSRRRQRVLREQEQLTVARWVCVTVLV